MTPAIPRPDPSEYAPHYETYVSKVPGGNLLEILEDQRQETQELLAEIPEGLHEVVRGQLDWSESELAVALAEKGCLKPLPIAWRPGSSLVRLLFSLVRGPEANQKRRRANDRPQATDVSHLL